MGQITLLDKNTIDQIAAGEVIERPASVVKELVENAIDAGATEVSVEIRDGGINYIRITDNGKGILKEDVPLAFTRHATSKIKSVEDLLKVCSLGFRGEALSSIASVAKVELLTKTKDSVTGTRYVINGGEEVSLTSVGIPNGTTIIVSNLFYNTPARRKYLGGAGAEAGRIMELLQAVALSHPEVGFKFVSQGKVRLLTYGKAGIDGQKEAIYAVLGRDVAKYIMPIEAKNEYISISGYIGKPEIGRGNRSYEYYFINGRYIKSKIIESAVEDAYKGFFMQHRYPLFVLDLEIPPEDLDVNVHPTKMELRLNHADEVYDFIYKSVRELLQNREWIIEAVIKETPVVSENKEVKTQVAEADNKPSEEKVSFAYLPENLVPKPMKVADAPEPFEKKRIEKLKKDPFFVEKPEQITLNTKQLLDEKSAPDIKIVGQVFDTYWILEFDGKMYIMDQHAAHEKLLYEKLIKQISERSVYTQMISPPVIITLTPAEERTLERCESVFEELGFGFSSFGGNEIALTQVPANLPALGSADAFMELLDSMEEVRMTSPEKMLDKCASMSCKAAVKGNMRLSYAEAKALINELMTMDNPYHCPHGRPTMISMTKQEIEKKFGRT